MIDLLILLLLVAGIVAVTAKFKISPFLALLAAAFNGAFAFHLPAGEIIPIITTAFGNTMGNIGLVILFGIMIGVILKRSGEAISMADALIKILGTRFPTLTMSIIGYIVSIPVFCDSGYIILNSLKKAMAERAQKYESLECETTMAPAPIASTASTGPAPDARPSGSSSMAGVVTIATV